MAKVISWRITNGGDELFAYITSTGSTDSPRIETKKLSQKEANRIGQIVTDWSEDEYTRHFEAMKSLISQEVGWSTDIGDASKYYNVLGNGEVLMLVGADGKNLVDQTNPFYSFHLSNQSIAIGTGEDYKLDLDAVIEGNAFFERDGVKYGCNGGITVQTSSDIQNYFQISYESGTESSDFKLTIKKGLQFPKYDAHMIEILIVGRRADGFEAKAVLTIAAVLGGKEGVSYDLVVSPKQFHYSSLSDATNSGNNDKITVGVLRNGKRLSSQEMTEKNLRVGYEYDPDGSKGLDVDIEDITYAQLTSEGTYEVYSSTIMNHGGSVSFYLISNGQYIDTDSASVVVDGVDGQDGAGVISLELENEFEAIGVGDDSKIDISGEGGVTAQTNVRVYSGETSLVIDEIRLEEESISSENEGKYVFEPIVGKKDSNGDHYGTIRIILKNGFEFGSDLRDKLNLRVTCQGISKPKPCNFTLLGVKGGKEGVVYRIEPSDDAIMYDPNANLVKFSGIEKAIPVSELTDGHTITAIAKAGMYTKTNDEITNDNEYISYSIGQTFSTAGAVITPTTPHINNKVKISDILGVSDPSSRFVTFYWIKKVGEEYYMLDRETVPVISAGRDGDATQGRQGAAIRGPVEWLSTAARRWCSGNGNASGVSMEEDYQYIDVIFRIVDSKKVYYVCTKSYTQTANTEWGTVSQYWTQTDEQYEFVASKVLLADNAYIDFLTGNEIYLRDSGGTVTAGAAGGNGISFWAGNDQPGNAPYQVNYDGSLKSTKGTFGCLTIGEDNSGHSSFFGHTVGDGYEYELNMSPAKISFKGALNSGTPQEVAEVVAICPSRNDEAIGGDYNAAINILCDESDSTGPAINKLAIDTNETIRAARFSQDTHTLTKNMKRMPYKGGMVSTPGFLGLEIVFQTSTPSGTTYFTKDGDNNTWRFLGMDTDVNYILHPYVDVQNSVSASDIGPGENPTDYLGYWAYYASPNGAKMWSGIAGPNITNKKSGVIYIQV